MKPMPTMRVARARSTATTYDIYEPAPLGCSARCTVNDQTGELSISSDWGTWSYTWSTDPRNLAAQNLTAFIAKMPVAEVDYVARKLQGGWSGGQRFDGPTTAKAMATEIATVRLAHGRSAIERWRDEVDCYPNGTPVHGSGRVPYTLADAEHELDCKNSSTFHHLTADAARHLADRLTELGAEFDGRHNGPQAEALFFERAQHVLDDGDYDWLFERIWEYAQTVQTDADRALREAILPALFEACRQTRVAAMLVACNGPQPIPDDLEVF